MILMPKMAMMIMMISCKKNNKNIPVCGPFFRLFKKQKINFFFFFSFSEKKNATAFFPLLYVCALFFFVIRKMNEVENPEKSKNKTVGRISRLFQKKPKKKMTSSLSSMSLSDPALSKGATAFQSSSSIASSQNSIINEPIESRNLPKLPSHQSDSGTCPPFFYLSPFSLNTV